MSLQVRKQRISGTWDRLSSSKAKPKWPTFDNQAKTFWRFYNLPKQCNYLGNTCSKYEQIGDISDWTITLTHATVISSSTRSSSGLSVIVHFPPDTQSCPQKTSTVSTQQPQRESPQQRDMLSWCQAWFHIRSNYAVLWRCFIKENPLQCSSNSWSWTVC